PVLRWKNKSNRAPQRRCSPATHVVVRADFSSDCFCAHLAAAKVGKPGGLKLAEAREAAAASRRLQRLTQRTRYPPTTRARLIRCAGIPLPFGVIVMQQFAAIALLHGPTPRRNELAFLSSLCVVKGRAGVCRPMQVTVRIKLPPARDAHDWRVHQRSSPTAEICNPAGWDLPRRHKRRVEPWAARALQRLHCATNPPLHARSTMGNGPES